MSITRTPVRFVFVSALLLVSTVPATAQLEDLFMGDVMVWPQFVAGDFDGGTFEVELTITNGSDTVPWAGRLSLSDENLLPPSGLNVEQLDANESYPLAIGPAVKQTIITILPRRSALIRITASNVQVRGFAFLRTDDAMTQGSTASLAQLNTSFAYNLVDSSGRVMDRIPIQPVLPSLVFQSEARRAAGFDTGFAIATPAETTVEVAVYLPGGTPDETIKIFQDMTITGQAAFFPSEFLASLPESFPSAFVEITSKGGPIAFTALDVVLPPRGVTVQIAAKQVRVVQQGDPLQR